MQDMSSPVPPPPAGRPMGSREWFDLSDIFRLYRRHLTLFLGIVAVCTTAAIVAAYLLPTTYEAVSRVRIDPQRRAVLDESIQSQNFQTDQARVDTEVQYMRSANIAQSVVRKLELWRDPRFLPEDAAAPVTTEIQREALIRQVARGIGNNFSVRRNGNSFIVDLVYTASDPQTAANLSNAFAQAYVDASGRLQSNQARQQSRYLEKQMTVLGSDVRQSDAQIAEYRARTGITQGGSAGTVTDQQIGPISSAFATAQSDSAQANGRLAAAQAQVRSGSLFSVSDVLNSSVITQLRAQRATLLNQKADLDTRYGANHPDTVRVASQLTATEGQIRDEAQRIVSRLQADAQAAGARAGALGARLSGLRSEQAGNTRAAVTADSLQRENNANREIYEKLAQQAQQTGQQAQVLQPSGTIVQVALPPDSPSFPNKKLFAAAGLLCGLMLGSVVIFTIDYMRRGLRSPDDVATLDVAFLASVPLITRRERASLRRAGHPAWDAVLVKPMSAFAEAMRTLRASVLDRNRAAGGTVITVISALPSEGKTHTAVSLAQICALSGDRTIIVDCDLRRPELARLLIEPAPFGLADVLEGDATLAQAVVRHSGSDLDILPIAAPDMSAKDLVGSPAFAALVEQLRAAYDVVVLDTPPVLAVASSRVIAKAADSVIFLAKWDETPRGAVRSALTVLARDGVQPIGLIFNMVDTRLQSSIGEDDPAYYQRIYAAYYQD